MNIRFLRHFLLLACVPYTMPTSSDAKSATINQSQSRLTEDQLSLTSYRRRSKKARLAQAHAPKFDKYTWLRQLDRIVCSYNGSPAENERASILCTIASMRMLTPTERAEADQLLRALSTRCYSALILIRRLPQVKETELLSDSYEVFYSSMIQLTQDCRTLLMDKPTQQTSPEACVHLLQRKQLLSELKQKCEELQKTLYAQ